MALRELQSDKFDSRGYTDENSLAALMLSKPDSISKKLTRLWSESSFENQFTFLSMTEGQGNIRYVNAVDYTWDVMGAMPHTDEILAFDAVSNPTPGLGNTRFKILMKTNWIIPQYGLIAPDGNTQAYVHGEPVRGMIGTASGWIYELELKSTDKNAYCDLSNLLAGKFWIMSAPNVPESGSVGNRSNVMAPGKMTNMISFNRYTKVIQGNLANKVVPIEFSGSDTSNGEATSLWINEEMRQFESWMRVMNNQDLYTQEYNKTADGRILLKDDVTGKPIPIGSGIRETVKTIGGYDTYGAVLPLRKLRMVAGDIFWGKPDGGKMEIIVHGGLGFGEDLHDSIMEESRNNGVGFMMAVGDKFINGTDGHLSYGNTFTQYKTPAGHTITYKHEAMFDTGLLGELDQANGNYHPRTGYPMSSHTGLFLDYSTYDGERNIELVQMKGQGYISGVVKGLAPVPVSWGSVNQNSFANDKDESSYQTKQSRGINIKDAQHCFLLECKL